MYKEAVRIQAVSTSSKFQQVRKHQRLIRMHKVAYCYLGEVGIQGDVRKRGGASPGDICPLGEGEGTPLGEACLAAGTHWAEVVAAGGSSRGDLVEKETDKTKHDSQLGVSNMY